MPAIAGLARARALGLELAISPSEMLSNRLAVIALGCSATLSCGPGAKAGIVHQAAALGLAPTPRAGFEPERLHEPAAPSLLGRPLGRFQLTHYWVAEERRAGRGALLRDPQCRPIARVSPSFAARLRLEGTGRLRDGRLLNITRRCRCGRTCYVDAEARGASWGLGVGNRKLEPFRSIAVDPRRIRIGSWVYVRELDGVRVPAHDGSDSYIHDGCLRADDRGGGVLGRQIDFFAGLRRYYRDTPGIHGLQRVTLRDGGTHCQVRVASLR